MLISQIPSSLIPSLEKEVKVNLGIFSAGIKESPSAPKAELAVKAGALSDYIEKTERVGSTENPERYIKGVALFQYGILRDYAADLVFFGGVVDGVKIGLIGSSSSLTGSVAETTSDHSPDYYVLKFLHGLAENEDDFDATLPFFSYERAIDDALKVLPKTRFRLEFLAKTLFHDSDVLVATPIYVALADWRRQGPGRVLWHFPGVRQESFIPHHPTR